MAQCATTAEAGVVPRQCVRGARGQFLGARAGTWCCVSPVSPFLPRVSRAACGGLSLSGCPLPSLAGTPFNAVCAFRELAPLALVVVPAPPLRVCALGRARERGHSHKPRQAQHHEVAQERVARRRRTEGCSTTHHGTTAHSAPQRTHQHTNTAKAPHTPHAPKPGRPPHGRAAHPHPRTRAHSK